jgi:hypothetical protein
MERHDVKFLWTDKKSVSVCGLEIVQKRKKKNNFLLMQFGIIAETRESFELSHISE